MSDAVLPSLLVLPIVWKSIHDELVDTVERDLFLGSRRLDGHSDEGYVRVRRLHHIFDGCHG